MRQGAWDVQSLGSTWLIAHLLFGPELKKKNPKVMPASDSLMLNYLNDLLLIPIERPVKLQGIGQGGAGKNKWFRDEAI